LREWLGVEDQTARHDLLIARREPGTLAWLLQGTIYNDWKSANSSSIWLHGIPGCGKSVISAAVAQDLEKTAIIGGRSALAYFYFDFSNEHASTAEGLLRSIITQISMHADRILTALNDFASRCFSNTRYRHNLSQTFQDGIAQPSYDDLVALLKSLLPEFEHTYVVIDALDECGMRDEILELMSKILSWNAEGFHVFLTSRYDAIISSELAIATEQQLSIAADHTKDDIELFVQSRMRQHKKLSKWPSNLKQAVEAELTSRADGLYVQSNSVLSRKY
jgi:ABC-type dipeptide/oligopeptide/nickel transport system ATPase component